MLLRGKKALDLRGKGHRIPVAGERQYVVPGTQVPRHNVHDAHLPAMGVEQHELFHARTGHAGAQRALEHFAEQVLKELAALAATLRGLDALVFTGGIGENGAALREHIVEGAAWLGLRLDPEANARGPGTITLQGSPVQALVMKTNEEAVIAGHTARLAGLSRQATPAI